MKVLIVTSEWPSHLLPGSGIFVYHQVEALRSLGVEIEVFHFRGRRNPFRYFNAFLKLRYTLRKSGFDLIHAHFGQAGFICSFQSQLPVVVTFHGSDLLGMGIMTPLGQLMSALLRSISLIAAKKAEEVITVSQRLSRELPYPSHIIPMGIDLSIFSPKPREEARKIVGWPFDKKIVLFVGDPTNPIKRYGLASQVVALVAQRLPDVSLQVCYSQPQGRVSDCMNAADVLLVTSLHEAGPLVVREAVACNRPVVSVDVGDVRERIGAINGCVVCENDRSETIASALVQVLSRGQQANSRQMVMELDEKLLSQKVIQVYRQAIDGARSK